jgi:thymidylate synthase (FAD)
MTTKIDVLDHGYVRLVDHMGSDLSIVRAARVSYDADWRTGQDAGKDEKLIRYLMRNRHTSPFESVVFTFEIKCPIFVARQWHRHRTWSYNEVSARYSELPAEFYLPEVDVITTQSQDNKQARSTEKHPQASTLRLVMASQHRNAFATYAYLLSEGCPRELARGVLPMSTYTRFFGTVNLHNLFHFLRLRLHAHAQYEIRVYAEAILTILRGIVPVAVAAFLEEAQCDGLR